LQKTQTTGNGNSTLESHTLAYEDAQGIYLNGNQASDTFTIASPVAGTPCQSTACTTIYTYDAKDRLVKYDNARGGLTNYTLLPNGQLKTEAFTNANGSNVKSYSYNAANGVQLTTLQRQINTATPTIQRFFYAHGDLFCVTQDDATTVSSRTDCPASTGGTISTRLKQAYGYDTLDRLDGSHAYSAGAETDSAQWAYDALDRPSTEQETHAIGAVNRSMAFDYLGLSNDIAKETWTGSGATTKTYRYDAAGSKAALTDSAGNKDLLYAYNPHGDVSQLLTVDGNAEAAYGYRPYGDEEQAGGLPLVGLKRLGPRHGLRDGVAAMQPEVVRVRERTRDKLRL